MSSNNQQNQNQPAGAVSQEEQQRADQQANQQTQESPQNVEVLEDTPTVTQKRREKEQAQLAANQGQAGAETTTNQPKTVVKTTKTTETNK